MTHNPRQLRRYIERGGCREELPNSARRHRPASLETDRQEEAVGGWLSGDVTRPSNAAGGGARDPEAARARARFRSAVHVVQATHRWQRQTQDAQSGNPWADMVRAAPLDPQGARCARCRWAACCVFCRCERLGVPAD
jgi:hypothetical protein